MVAFTTSKDPTCKTQPLANNRPTTNIGSLTDLPLTGDNALPAIWGFIEKVGPSYNKRAISRAPSHTPTQASTRSSEIFPRDLSYHFSSQFRGLYQSRGRKDSDTYTPHRVSIPQSYPHKSNSILELTQRSRSGSTPASARMGTWSISRAYRCRMQSMLNCIIVCRLVSRVCGCWRGRG